MVPSPVGCSNSHTCNKKQKYLTTTKNSKYQDSIEQQTKSLYDDTMDQLIAFVIALTST
jgi:hypothetical protein